MATEVKHYRVYCTTESNYQYVWSEQVPTVCPSNSGHSIDSTQTTVIETITDANLRLADGKALVAPNIFPEGTFAFFTDRADDIVNGVIWGDSRLTISNNTEDNDTVLEFQFLETVHLAAGKVYHKGGLIGDYLRYEVYAPATAGTSNPGSGQYNKYEIVPSSGMYMYTYAPLTDGDWDLNLTEKLNANVDFTKAVPVPNVTGTGWFDYDYGTDSLTVNTGNTGEYDLFDFNVPLSAHIPSFPLMGDGITELAVDSVKTEAIFPHYKHKVTVHHGAGTHQIDIVNVLIGSRSKTV